MHAIHELGIEPSFWTRLEAALPSRARVCDLSLAEQANVRALLQVLRVKLGGQWQSVAARALPVAQSALTATMSGRTEVPLSQTAAPQPQRRSGSRSAAAADCNRPPQPQTATARRSRRLQPPASARTTERGLLPVTGAGRCSVTLTRAAAG